MFSLPLPGAFGSSGDESLKVISVTVPAKGFCGSNRELWGSLPTAVRRFRHGCFGIGYETDDAHPEYARFSGILRVDPPKLECFSVAKPVARCSARDLVPKILQLNSTSFDRSQA